MTDYNKQAIYTCFYRAQEKRSPSTDTWNTVHLARRLCKTLTEACALSECKVLLRRQALNKGHTNEMRNYKQWAGLRKKDHKKILSSGISFDWGGQTDQIRCFWESALNVQVGECMMELTIRGAEYWGKQWEGWIIGWGRRLAMNISACQVCWAGELEEKGRDEYGAAPRPEET